MQSNANSLHALIKRESKLNSYNHFFLLSFIFINKSSQSDIKVEEMIDESLIPMVISFRVFLQVTFPWNS